MGKSIQMLGNTYGELTVIEEFAQTNKKKCVCQCSCGKVVEKTRRDVKSGNTKSCGCLKKRLAQERYTKDLTGQRFGKLVVNNIVRNYEQATSDGAYWRCKCDCGGEKIVHRSDLMCGNITSCGCKRREHQRSLTKDLVGQVYNEWTVLQNFVSEEDSRCVAKCSCGQVDYVDRHNLTSGKIKGCKKCMGKRMSEKQSYCRLGQRQGRLEIIDIDEEYNYVCRCDCGKTKTIKKANWNTGVRSCGCYKAEMARQRYTDDLTGKTFGNITVLKVVYRDNNSPKWLCKCSCGHEFETHGGTLKNGSGMCVKCWAKHNSGENNPSWNPNLTKEDRARRRCTQDGKQSKWRKQVFERDNYTCQCCGERGGKLNAHHKDGYNWCEERRFDVTNGVTLCVNCHRTFHSYYGIKDNTEEQYEDFLLNMKEWV